MFSAVAFAVAVAVILLVGQTSAQTSGTSLDNCTCEGGLVSVCKDLELMGELRTVCGCSSSGEAEPPYESPCLGPHHREQCACTKELEPQCDRGGKEIAPNRCVAECMGYEQWQVNMYHCGSIPPEYHEQYFADWSAEDLAMFAQHNPQCELACEADPLEAVCDKQGTEISSKGCLAKCHGYAENEFSAQYCADGYRDAKLCKCDVPTAKDKPVCNSKGTPISNSACLSECLGYSAVDVNAENCGKAKGNQPCICPLSYSPYCDDKGTVMAGNGCQAACMYDKAEIAAMDESNCGAKGKLLHDNAACGCSDPEEPMCDRFMTEVAKSPCIAKCAGYTDAKPCSVKNSNNRTIVDLPGDKGTDVIIGFNLPESNEDGDKEPGTILIVKDGASNQNSINGEDKEATDGGGLSVLDPPVGSVTTFDVRNNTDDNSSTTIARRQDVVLLQAVAAAVSMVMALL